MSILSSHYFEHVKHLIDKVGEQTIFIERIAEEIANRAINGRYTFVIGNGGSASTASHFACNISKNSLPNDIPKPKLICLSDNVPLLTAWANDKAYEDTYRELLRTYLNSEDLIIAISASGNSPNIINAVNYAKGQGAMTFGLTGYDGGQLANLVDQSIIVNAEYMEQIEDVHLFILHLVSLVVAEKVRDKYEA